MGVLVFAAPALSALFSPRLDAATLALVVARLIVLALHVKPCLEHVRLSTAAIDWRWIPPMLRFGGWLTVSSIVGPLIVYVDRFFIGATLSANAIAYYSAPFEIVSRLLIVPAALSSALFPAVVALGRTDSVAAVDMRRKATSMTLLVSGLLCVIGTVFAHPLLAVWLGAEFASNGSLPLRILLPGFALNALAQIPLMALYSIGCTRAVALLHLMQFPLYAVALWALVSRFGIAGAAVAWSMRAALDWMALSWLLRRRGAGPGGTHNARLPKED